MAGHIGRKSALVADRDAHAPVMQDGFERMKHFSAIPHGFPKARRANRDNHEFLQIQVVVGMRAAVHHIHHRHRHLHGRAAAEIAVQRQAGFFGSSPGHCHADGQHGIGTQARFVFGAVQVNQRAVQKSLLAGVQAQHSFRNLIVDKAHGFEHALAQVA